MAEGEVGGRMEDVLVVMSHVTGSLPFSLFLHFHS